MREIVANGIAARSYNDKTVIGQLHGFVGYFSFFFENRAAVEELYS